MAVAGEKRHRIIFQEIVETVNDFNEKVQTWKNIGKRWAQVEGSGGSEITRAQQIEPRATHLVTIWSDEFTRLRTTENRILWGTRTLNIISIDDADGIRKELKVICEEAR